MRFLTFIIFAISILLIGVGAQEPPKPKLVDEFGLIVCGNLNARTDGFAQEIKLEPTAKALILIYPPTFRPEEQAERQRRRISTSLQLSGLDVDRFQFRKAGRSPDGQIKTEFWKLPMGAEQPETDAVLWNEEPPEASRAFIFGSEDEYGICPTFVPRAFAKLILDNPGSRGHVVVTQGDAPMLNKFYFADEWIKELVEKQGVPRKRLRLFFAKGKGPTAAEFWFVPAKKR